MTQALAAKTPFDLALDEIYASFMVRKHQVAGKLDKEIRDPSLLINLARELDLLPPKERVIRITGSKGKGTTSRMIAQILQKESDGKIALLVSPEELDHNDRMRINDQPAAKQTFLRQYAALRPHLQALEETLPTGRYLSPMGTFLLIALSWFKEQKVDYWVLETGRGARYDEVGILPSSLSVLTSIMLEHPSYLGPDIENIADNKLAIGLTSDKVIAGKDCLNWNNKLNLLPPEKLIPCDPERNDETMPGWFGKNRALALKAAELFLKRPLQHHHDLYTASAAFGAKKQTDKSSLYFDACIAVQSLDLDFLKNLTAQGKLVIIASLPDDKDGAGLRTVIKDDLHCPYYDISLSGTRGYLHYEQAKTAGHHLAEIDFNDVQSLQAIHADLMEKNPDANLYYLGTQTFIRLVRKAFEI
ncbi:MAG: hypothetical protein OIF56_12885 [Cohaesibacter sp.]|nr:hypothetical protein [Cohaesibacter sp.]